MAQQFTNNARALLVAGISDTDTSFVVESAKADLFPVANTGINPVPAATNWFKVTLQNSSGAVEIVAVRTRTAGSGIMSNVLRGQDGTTALNFLAGTVVGLRITAEDVQTALDLPNQNNTFTGDNTFSGNNTFTGDNIFEAPIDGDLDGNLTAAAPTAATQAYGTNSTAIATTAFVQAALQAIHPVGSVYINATNATNPGTLLGFGTWVAFGAGRVPVGFNAADPLFDTAEETGGSKDAVVVSHSHTATVSDPGHSHFTNVSNEILAGGAYSTVRPVTGGNRTSTDTTGITVSNSTTGSSGTNANLQPYITVFMWKRTA